MKLTIIGRNGPYPAANGVCSGYLLESEATKILIDCGTGVLARLPDYTDCAELDAVVLSHLHYDHMSDMLPMIYNLQFHRRKSPLPVFLPDTPENVRALLNAPCYAPMPMRDGMIGDIALRFFAVRHPVETYALRAEVGGRVFVYTGDTNEVPGLADFAADVDCLLADSGLSEADWRVGAPHLSAYRCGTLAAEARAKRLLLTHLNPKYDSEALAAEAAKAFANVDFVCLGGQYII